MTLFFLHIPRTAGTTLNSIITRIYPDPTTMKLPNFVDAETLRSRLLRYQAKNNGNLPRVCRGHINFGIHELLPGRYFTLLRDPVARLMSHYGFARWKNSDTVKNDAGAFVSVEELIDPNRVGMNLTNIQARMIAGTYSLFRRSADENIHAPFESENELFEAAKANLDAIDGLGVTERFDDTILLLKRAFGWPLPVYVRHNAVANRPSELDPALEKRIRQVNAVDCALYDEVVRRMEATLRRHTTYFFFVKHLFHWSQSRFQKRHAPQRVRHLSDLPALEREGATGLLGKSN